MANSSDVLRTKQINLRLSDDELARLERLAGHLALSEQSALRLMLKRASDEFESTGQWPPAGTAPAQAKKPRRK